jgi:branched-subunit amino acid transport protein
MSATVALIAGCTVVTVVTRGIGPAVLGGRELPEWFQSVVVLLAPALLAALIVTQALAHGHRIHVGANTVGVIAGGLVAWRLGSVVACVAVAAVLTAVLRAL